MKKVVKPVLKVEGETEHGDRVYFDDRIDTWMVEVTRAINYLYSLKKKEKQEGK